MFGNLRSFSLTPRLRSWTTDGSEEQREGERLLEAGDYAGAELYLVKAMVESERRQQSPEKRILLRLELAEAQRKQFRSDDQISRAKLAAAEETVRSASELASRSGERAVLVHCLDTLAGICCDQENWDEAERLWQEAAEVEAKLKRSDPLRAARRLHRMAVVRHQRGQSGKAVDALTECVAIHTRVLGEEHLDTANRLSELGSLHYALGNHAEAQKCLRRAIRIHERECGIDSKEAVSDLQMLTGSLEASGDIDGAASQFERVLGLKLRAVGIDLDAVAVMQTELAHRYIGWRRYSRARELLMEAVGTFRRTGGARLAVGYESLAQLEEDSGHYHDAIRELARAAKVWETIQHEHAAELIQNMEHRAFLFEQLRQHKEAAFLREKTAALIQAVQWVAAG
jgi:tetratricopeptide (TPR) repeat protein